MFQIDSESYEELKIALKELLQNCKKIKTIEINKVNYKIDMKLGGDMKCLALLMGINAANSKQACLWCKVDLKKPVDLKMQWKFSRSQKEASDSYKNNENGYKYEPIINFIDFYDVVIDMLHLLLRITDQLFLFLLEKLIKFDLNDSVNLEKRELFSILESFLKFNCKLTRPFRFSKLENGDDTMHIKLRSFNGNERLKIFEKLFENGNNFEDLFCNVNIEFELENFVWKEFYIHYMFIKSLDNQEINLTITQIDILKKDLLRWLEFYIPLSGKKTITPYVHAFVFHVPEFIENLKMLNLYNVQGLEKLNDLTTHYYHSSTNKHNIQNEYLIQLLKKQNRMEFLNLGGKFDELL